MKKAQVTAEKTAWLEIIAHAQSHLTSPKARARYDRTLAARGRGKVRRRVGVFALQGSTRLDPGTRAALDRGSRRLGIGSERGDRLIARACRKLGVRDDGGSVAPLPGSGRSQSAASPDGVYEQLRCRHCAGVTEVSPVARKTSPARCRHCGASLKWECPVCRRRTGSTQPKCGCGFPLALREPLVRHFAAALHAFRASIWRRRASISNRFRATRPPRRGAERNGQDPAARGGDRIRPDGLGTRSCRQEAGGGQAGG